MAVSAVLDSAGRRRSPATMPGYHAGRSPRIKGLRYPADPPTVEEIVAVMRQVGADRHGARLRAVIVVLWRVGYSPFEAGVRYLPITLISFFVAPIAGALLSRVQARLMLCVGLAGVGAGLLLMGGIDAGSEWTTLLGGFLVAGAAIGLLNPVIADVAVSVVPKEQSGMASGINDTFRQVGIAVGIAVWERSSSAAAPTRSRG